jgi:hypothetical protein
MLTHLSFMTKNQNKSLPVEEPPDLSYLDAKVTVTNIHPFRRQGRKCRYCGSNIEILFIEVDKIFLVCAGCDRDKGHAPFVGDKLILKGEGIPHKDVL